MSFPSTCPECHSDFGHYEGCTHGTDAMIREALLNGKDVPIQAEKERDYWHEIALNLGPLVHKYEKRCLVLGMALMDAAQDLHDTLRRAAAIPRQQFSGHEGDFDRCESPPCAKFRKILDGAQ